MASRQRQWTGYPGVYFVEKLQKKGGGKERVYYVVYRKGGRQVEEKVGHQYKDAMTPVRASRIRGERIEKNITHELPKKQGYTLNQLWAHYREINGDKASSRGDIYRYNNYIAPVFGEKTPDEMVTLDIDRLRSELLVCLRPQTVKHVLEQIKRILNFAVKKNFILAPTHLQFEMPVVDNQKTEMMTPEQISAFLSALDEEQDQTGASGVRLALATGMRHGAIVALRWDDLDFSNGFILLRGEVAKNGANPSDGQPLPLSGKEKRNASGHLSWYSPKSQTSCRTSRRFSLYARIASYVCLGPCQFGEGRFVYASEAAYTQFSVYDATVFTSGR